MKQSRVAFAFTGLVLAAAATTGCGNRAERSGHLSAATPPAANRPTPADLPPDVMTAFRREFPNAGVTNVEQMSAETGAPMYRVTFIDNQKAGSATYFHNGQKLNQPNR